VASFRDAFPNAFMGGDCKAWHVEQKPGSGDALGDWIANNNIFVLSCDTDEQIAEEFLHPRRQAPKYAWVNGADGKIREQMRSGQACVVQMAESILGLQVRVFERNLEGNGMTREDREYEDDVMAGADKTHIVHMVLDVHLRNNPPEDEHPDQTQWSDDSPITQPEEEPPIGDSVPEAPFAGNWDVAWAETMTEIQKVDPVLGGAIHKSSAAVMDGKVSIHIDCNTHYMTAFERLSTIRDAVCKVTQYRWSIEIWREDRTTALLTRGTYPIPSPDVTFVYDKWLGRNDLQDIEYVHACERLGLSPTAGEWLVAKACEDDYNGYNATVVRRRSE
jgi:hypothetical protein